MQTFVAQFVRSTGEQGVVRLTAANSLGALLEVFITQGEVSILSVQPQRRAALLSAPPAWHPHALTQPASHPGLAP
jgi:hypothetical protein